MAGTAVALDEGIGRKELTLLRRRFLRLRDLRLGRIMASLHLPQQAFLRLLPLLFHSNHPGLPGYVSAGAPIGLPDYRPDHSTLLAARGESRSFRYQRRALLRHRLRGLYLMGSLGSLGQDADSDLDIWLCHADDLTPGERAALRAKVEGVEAWGEGLGLKVHIFPLSAGEFRRGEGSPLSEESCGDTQHHLLLEEFYRTGVLLAGLPPLWWLVPPGEEHDYDGFTRRLLRGRFVNPGHWLDFGGLQSLPPEEFFSAALWQLHKGIDAPYKALLKLMLMESYAASHPDTPWLALETKRALYAGEAPDPDRLDPYRLMLAQVTRYLQGRGEQERLDLLRRSFYVKTGLALSREVGQADWKRELLQALTRDWGWGPAQLRLLDTRPQWKVERVVAERRALVAELSHSYRLLTEFARRHSGSRQETDGRELSLLGRKLYAALERRPGKVERINPGISRDLQEPELWIRLRPQDDTAGRWQLFHRDPEGAEEEQAPPLKAANDLVELLAWAHLNDLAGPATHLHLLPRTHSGTIPEPVRILKALRRHLCSEALAAPPLEVYAAPPRALCSLAFVNVGRDPQGLLTQSGYQRTSLRSDPLSFAATHDCLVEQVTHLMVTSWGEVLVETHHDGITGLLDSLCQHLNMSWDPAVPPLALIVNSYSSPRADAIARRVGGLVDDLWETFRRLGGEAGYLLRAEDDFYLLERRQGHFRWVGIGDEEALLDWLGEPHDRFRPLHLEPGALTDTPLPLLLEANREGEVQVYYRLAPEGIHLFVLDEQGVLYRQLFSGAGERHFLVQQARFFESLETRRLLRSPEAAGALLGGRTRFHRLEHGPGGWRSREVRVPRATPGEHLELQLITGPGGPLQGGFTLVAGNREFDSLTLGERLYPEVRRHLLARRGSGQDYPIYLTGVTDPAGAGGGASVAALLHFKRLLERRLNQRTPEAGP